MEDYLKLCDLIISHSDTDVVLEYIEKNNINVKTFQEVCKTCSCPSPLGLAIKHGHLLVVDKLINLGFDPATPCEVDDVLWLPLHLACENNESQIILSLRHDHRLDLDSVDSQGYTALVRTILHSRGDKSTDVVMTLVQAGASVNKSCDSPASVNSSSSPGATVNSSGSPGATVNSSGSPGATVNSSCPPVWTPLSAAIERNNIDVFRYLVSKGADVHGRNVNRYFRYAIKCREDICIVRLFIAAGTDVNATDDENKSPLMYAVGRNMKSATVQLFMTFDQRMFDVPVKADVIRLLLESGADVNATDKEMKSPLAYATENHAVIDAIQLLLDHGADVNAQDKNDKSPLCYVLESCPNGVDANAMDTVRVLIESGADVNLLDGDLISPLTHALKNKANTEVIRLLVDAGSDINILDKYKKSPLHYALENYEIDLLKVVGYLIESGADVNALDTRNVSPLVYALMVCSDTTGYGENYKPYLIDRVDVVRLLLEFGAKVNLDNEHKSPLHYALQHTCPSVQPDLVQLLINFGAEVNIPDEDRTSPLMFAIMTCWR